MFPTANAGPAGAPPGAAPAAPQVLSTICISAMADGTFMVYQDSEEGDESDDAAGADPTAAAGAAPAPDDDSDEMAGGQSAKDIDSALQLAKQMIAQGGQDGGEAPEDDNASADALFQQGFGKARGTPLNRG